MRVTIKGKPTKKRRGAKKQGQAKAQLTKVDYKKVWDNGGKSKGGSKKTRRGRGRDLLILRTPEKKKNKYGKGGGKLPKVG